MSVEAARRYIVKVPNTLGGDEYRDFLRELKQLLTEKPQEVTLDCSSIEYATPGHISAIWRAHVECLHNGLPVNISSLTRNLKRVLRSLDLYDYLVREGEFLYHEPIDGIGDQLRDRPPEFRVKFCPTVDDVNQAMAELNTRFMNSGLTEVESFELQTAFYEIATNVRLHSHSGESSTAWLEVFTLDDGLILKLVAEGPPFDPTQQEIRFDPEEAIKNGQRRKIGLAMVNRLVDGVHYEREDDRLNVLYLKKRFLTITRTVL